MPTETNASPGCAAPDDTVHELLRRLQGRRNDVVSALRGDSLRVQVILVGERTHAYRVMFTGGGFVLSVGTKSSLGEQFRPAFVLAGTPSEVARILIGTETVDGAIARGLLVPYADPAPFEALRALVGAELVDLFDERP